MPHGEERALATEDLAAWMRSRDMHSPRDKWNLPELALGEPIHHWNSHVGDVVEICGFEGWRIG
jgi:hypothetical protein